jgi:NAD(P)-dependent dehydrogenase (short-subunit alcohol dehydrogenase family)
MSEIEPGAVLVTGASVRVGRAIAIDMASQGWAVAVHYNSSREAAADVVDEIKAAGGTVVALDADLAKEQDMQQLVPRAVEALGPLTCLVNNAARFEDDTPENATRATWDTHMEVNLRAPFVLSQAFIAQRPREKPGNIINILDQRVWNLTPYFTTYTVSKAGLWTLTQTLALALAPEVRVNAIGPGPILPSSRQTQEQFERQFEALPLKRKIGLDDICAAVRFILAVPTMTGQMIALDSGQHLGWAQHVPGGAPTE